MTFSVQDLLLLAILSESERYGYEIFGILRLREITDRYQIAFSSIYAVLNRLSRRGLIAVREYVQPPRPPRRIYSLTEVGRIALEKAIFSAEESSAMASARFDIALISWPILSIEKRKNLLITHISYLRGRQENFKRRAEEALSPSGAAFFERPLRMIMAELDWLKEFARREGIQLVDRS